MRVATRVGYIGFRVLFWGLVYFGVCGLALPNVGCGLLLANEVGASESAADAAAQSTLYLRSTEPCSPKRFKFSTHPIWSDTDAHTKIRVTFDRRSARRILGTSPVNRADAACARCGRSRARLPPPLKRHRAAAASRSKVSELPRLPNYDKHHRPTLGACARSWGGEQDSGQTSPAEFPPCVATIGRDNRSRSGAQQSFESGKEKKKQEGFGR